MASGDALTPQDDGDDLAARLADPVLAGALAEAPPPGDPPDVWGRLVDSDAAATDAWPLDAAAAAASPTHKAGRKGAKA